MKFPEESDTIASEGVLYSLEAFHFLCKDSFPNETSFKLNRMRFSINFFSLTAEKLPFKLRGNR